MATGTDAEARPGVVRLIDEARQTGIKVAVCSAATKSSVVHVVKSLLGDERFEVTNQCYGLSRCKHTLSSHSMSAARQHVSVAKVLWPT